MMSLLCFFCGAKFQIFFKKKREKFDGLVGNPLKLCRKIMIEMLNYETLILTDTEKEVVFLPTLI